VVEVIDGVYFDLLVIVWCLECCILLIMLGVMYYVLLDVGFICLGWIWWVLLVDGMLYMWCEVMMVYYEGVFGYYL